MPPGVRVQNGGDAEIMAEVFAGSRRAMGAGLTIVLAVLVLLFGDVFQPVTILLSLPLSPGRRDPGAAADGRADLACRW